MASFPAWTRSNRTLRTLLVRIALTLVVVLGLGCEENRSIPELLSLTEMTPRSVGPGDRVDIFGRDLPVGQVERVEVIFTGHLFRPGQAPIFDQKIVVDDARLERDRISFEMDELLLERFAGRGDDAKHTTFRGRVQVRMPGASSSMPVVGSIKSEVTLDVVPRSGTKRVRELAEEKSTAAQGFFGWSLDADGAGNVTVREVREGSAAARAGAKAGDALVVFNGVDVMDPTDAVPSGLEGETPIALERSGERVDVVLDTRGYRGDVEAGLLSGVVILGTALLLMLLFGTRLGRAASWMAHRMRDEIAKQRAPGGSVLAAVVRAAVHDARKGTPGQGTFAAIAPVVVAIGVSVSFAVLPFIELRRRAELDIGILYLVSVTALVAMGLVTGGLSRARSIVMRRLRAVVEVLLCELPAASALAAVVVTTGSLRVSDVVLSQVGPGGTLTETGSFPWAWNALRSPQLFLLFALFFVTALIDAAPAGTRRDGARSSSSLGSAAFFFAEWTHVFVMCALGTIAFLGGYALPGVAATDLYAQPWLQVLGCVVFLAKCWALAFVVLVLRASLPRIRSDVLLRVGVRLILPASAVGLAITAVMLRFPLLPTAERALGLVTMTAVLVGIVLVVGSVFSALRSATAEAGLAPRTRVNPFL